MAVDLDASMASLRHLHEEGTRMQQKQFTRIHMLIGSLQQEKCKLENDFERQLEYHARADCKQLTNMMHTKLPQELKEVIYQYLYLEDVPVPVGSYHFTTYVPEPLRSNNTNPPAHSKPFIVVPEGAETQDHSVERDDSIIYPDSRLLDPAYVGYDVARDASKYYYKNNTFSVCTLENAISDFLFRDPIHNFTTQGGIPKGTEILNIIPIDYIRNLQIRIKYEHFGAYFTFYNNLRQGEKDLIQGIYDILYNLSHCISSPSAAALHVEFCMMTAYSMELAAEDDYVERHHMNLLEAIRVPVYMLKHDLKADIKVIHYDEHCMPFPKDCTAIFQLPEAEWLRERKAFEDAGIEYSPWQYHVSHEDSNSESVGFPLSALSDVIAFRWGLRSAFASSSVQNVEFGRYPNELPETGHR